MSVTNQQKAHLHSVFLAACCKQHDKIPGMAESQVGSRRPPASQEHLVQLVLWGKQTKKINTNFYFIWIIPQFLYLLLLQVWMGQWQARPILMSLFFLRSWSDDFLYLASIPLPKNSENNKLIFLFSFFFFLFWEW